MLDGGLEKSLGKWLDENGSRVFGSVSGDRGASRLVLPTRGTPEWSPVGLSRQFQSWALAIWGTIKGRVRSSPARSKEVIDMRTLPTTMVQVLAPFVPLFSERVFQHVQLLVTGTILAPGKRTVASALRAVGLQEERRFCRYHRVLSRALWSSREVGRVLLELPVEAFAPDGPLVLGVDETLERRRGKRIVAKGIYRDPVRSSHEHFVKTSGLRWVCLTLLAPVPWASREWALPFLSTLAHSERYAKECGKPHKPLTEWAWQMLLLVRRWYPKRQIVAVGDGGYASLKLLDRCRRLKNPITFITRLRLDAALYEPAPPRKPGQMGRPRLKGSRLPNLSAVVEDPRMAWMPITVRNWYGGGERTVEIVSDSAIW